MEALTKELRAFAEAREWGRFHTPKNLAMALSVEAAEIVQLFQWLTPEQSAALTGDQKQALSEEIGDVQIYLAMLADKTGIDPLEAAREKLKKNARKYPAEKARGRADRSDAYHEGETP